MTQHSPADHQRLFQHRNMDKWMLDGKNRKIGDFWHEDLCREFLAELRSKWDGVVAIWPPKDKEPTETELAAIKEMENKTYLYKRVGYDEREMELLPNGMIGKGNDRCERTWAINTLKGQIVLTIFGTTPTCHLKRDKDGVFKGKWLAYEKMNVELVPIKNN